MTETGARQRWLPSRTSLIAGSLVIAGFWLMSFSWWFFLLVAVGTFGPGVLREAGLLRDRDEFQRRADHRAGYHAFLIAGIMAFVLVAFLRSGERAIPDLQELPTLFLALLWFTWLLSSLMAFWGPQKTAGRILRIFGTVVLAFTIVSNLGPEWTGWTALLLHPLLALPFFALAWLAGRSPRLAGVLLLAISLVFFQLFGWGRDELKIDNGTVFILFLGPLLASGVALVGMRGTGESEEDDEEA